jgi:DNA-binding SARP family transcriptional activator/CRP-like cAMP-binding protein
MPDGPVVSVFVDIRLLGPLQVFDRSGQSIEISGELPKALLALLALEAPASVSSDRIVDALWGEHPPDSPEASLHSTVSRLRHALGKDIIKRVADGYVLEIPVANSDLARFRRHVQRGVQFRTLGHPAKGAEAFRQSLAQWRGSALSDLHRFEFAEQARRQLEEERLLAVEALMDTELLAGDHAMVLGELSGLVESFPLRERLWGQLILALYRSGRQADALRAFARVKATLADELGVEPSPELTNLEERILLHDPALTEFADPATGEWLDSPELISFSTGDTVVEEGSPSDAVYWVEAGEVEIYRTAADGSEVPLARLGAGRYFGELASLLGTGRTASVRAAAPTTLSVHSVESFRRRLGTERVRLESVPGSTDKVRQLVRQGQYLEAYDLATGQLEMGSGDLELRYLAVLALARSGATIQARRRYDSFGLASVEEASISTRLAEDLAALDARLDKDIAIARDGEQRQLWARRSATGYGEAFDRHRSPYLAVNAATMWLLAGDEAKAAASARQGLGVLSDARPVTSDDRYWLLVSEAEAALVLGDLQQAEDALGRAGQSSESAFASRATTLRQLKLVCQLKGFDPSVLAAIANPTVVHFCGHRIGTPGEGSRFPAEEEPRVLADLKAAFGQVDAGMGYGSLAAGADIMAAEVLLKRGAELHITLPFDRAEFVRTSVAPAGPAWVRRFERCLASAAEVVTAVRGEYLDDPTLFDFCARIAMGDALVRARQLEADVCQVAVWDGVETGQAAGTSVDVARWKAGGHPATIIPAGRSSDAANGAVTPPKRQVRALLFADFAGFSRLSDAQVLLFQETVMSEIGRSVEKYEAQLLSGRTWGDGLHLVFSEVGTAAQCALDLQTSIGQLDFEAAGLHGLRGLRLAGHAAPVFEGSDPITGARLFFGAGVTQTARIEPRTPEGEIYVTHPFAALAALAGDKSIICQYVGTLPTAKGYGSLPLYALHQKV